jgi:hypothetical protein
MKMNTIYNSLIKAAVAVSLAFGLIVIAGGVADAQYGGYGSYGRNGGYGNGIYQIAQQNGYNDGLRKGAEDAREGHNNPTGTSDYRNATNGYNSRMGNKDAYREAYRQGFLQGFNEAQSRAYNGGYGNGGYGNGGYNNGGYGRTGGYPTNGGYGNRGGYGNYGGYGNNTYQIAQQNGYNDGLRKGQEDAREGHNNPTGTSEYRNAMNGYDSRMGDRRQYQQAYRQGFLQGFAEGQRGGRYNGRGYGRH